MGTRNTENLFWSRVTKGEGCWVHSGSFGSHGYPQATGHNGQSGPAHRLSWILHNGDIGEGLFVCHRCNNKLCVRPDHLYLGTHKQNMDDMAKAGHPNRLLTYEAVQAARSSGKPIRQLARELGVSQKAVQLFMRGVTYRYPGVVAV